MPNHAWLEEYLQHLHLERHFSPNTTSAYRSDLQQFFKFLESREIPISQVDAKIADGFAAQQKKRGLTETSVLRKLHALRSFWNFLAREGRVAARNIESSELPKIWKKLPPFLTEAQVQQLLQAPNQKTFCGVRDRALLMLLYSCGLRVSEVCQLNVHDVEESLVRVLGKGDKQRLVPILGGALSAIDLYLHMYGHRFKDQEQRALFLNTRGQRLTRIAIWRRVKKYSMSIGVHLGSHPHALRHSFATHLMNKGVDVRVIQELLGHANIATTDRYTHLNVEKLRAEFDRYHPRNASF